MRRRDGKQLAVLGGYPEGLVTLRLTTHVPLDGTRIGLTIWWGSVERGWTGKQVNPLKWNRTWRISGVPEPMVMRDDMCAHGCGLDATVAHADGRYLCYPCYRVEVEDADLEWRESGTCPVCRPKELA